MPLLAQALITNVLQTCKAPGYTAQAKQLLNMILADLADTQDLDLCRGLSTGTFTVDNGSGNGSGPYTLPADYKRVERDGAWYVYNGISYPLVSVDLTEYRQQVQQTGLASLPEIFATDISPQGQSPASNALLYVWPPSNGAYTYYVQYRRLLPDIESVSTQYPWFPNQEYLRLKLSAAIMELTDDDRKQMFEGMADKVLRNFMQLTNDDEGRAKTVTLDRRRFSSNWRNLKDTKTIFSID